MTVEIENSGNPLVTKTGDSVPNLGIARAFLVGAGPGNPDLLTLRGKELLGMADVVIYDRLVNPELLKFCPKDCETISVSNLDGTHPEKWPEICRLLVEKAKIHRVVVRLKGGDPFLFGRGAEECEALNNAEIPFEVVPGVSSGLGAPAWAGIPVTHRLHSSAVAFVTAHELTTKESLIRWENLSAFPGTLVFFMPLHQIENLKERLVSNGKAPETPVALIEKGTLPAQKVKITTLREMPLFAKGMKSPTLVVVGDVVSLHRDFDWVSKRPLSGTRILLTRPSHQSGPTMELFQKLGAEVENEPLVELEPCRDWEPLEGVFERLDSFAWIVFSSATGVQTFFRRIREKGWDSRRLGRAKIACIGPSTAAALAPFFLQADLIAPQFSSEGLAAELKRNLSGGAVLLVRADRGRDLLPTELGKVASVTQVAVYNQIDSNVLSEKRVAELLSGKWKWVVLGSSNIARNFARLMAIHQIPKEKVPFTAAISPITAQTIRECGMDPTVVAEEYHFPGVVKAIQNFQQATR